MGLLHKQTHTNPKMPIHNAVFGNKLGHYSLLRTSPDLVISHETRGANRLLH